MPKPVIHGRDHAPGGADPIPFTLGIQYEVTPQTGAWLDIETVDVFGSFGVRIIANLGTFSINAVDEDVEIVAGRNVEVTAAEDVELVADQDVNITGTRDVTLRAVDGSILLVNVPTTDPHILRAVWNDGGTLKLSAG